MDDKSLEDLDFADDIVLLSASHEDLQEKTEKLKFYSEQLGLQINTSKTKIMDYTQKTSSIILNNNALEKVSHFSYLGSKITTDGDTNAEIMTRIALAANAFNRLSNIWRSKTLGNQTKIRLFNACVISVLTYGCESWKSTITMERKLVAFENKCLRKITNTNWKDYKSNDELRKETKQKYITTIIRKRRWAYIGHALRMSEDKIPRQTIMWSPEGKRKRGRPKETLRRTIEREAKTIGLKTQDLQDLATNRKEWKTMTSALCAKLGTRGI